MRPLRRPVPAPLALGLAFALGLPLALAGPAAPVPSSAPGPWTPRADALPPGLTAGLSMDAKAGDVDGDGDADLVLAMEWAPVQLLLNRGDGRLHADPTRLPQTTHDHEESVLADLDGDGDLDLVVVSEDDRAKALWLNDGRGRFSVAPFAAAGRGISNGVAAADVDGDGDRDLVLANADGDVLLRNDGRAGFRADAGALPAVEGVSQDVVAADVDADGDLDLLFGKENGSRLLLNDGRGRFADADPARWPRIDAETRKLAVGDVDGDGDLDVVQINTRFTRPQVAAQDRLLLNDGRGRFVDATDGRLPADSAAAAHGDLHDLDGDGDLDLVSAEAMFGPDGPPPIRALLNDGNGRFAPAPATLWPDTIRGPLFDSVMLDLDGDGRDELYLALRGAPDAVVGR